MNLKPRQVIVGLVAIGLIAAGLVYAQYTPLKGPEPGVTVPPTLSPAPPAQPTTPQPSPVPMRRSLLQLFLPGLFSPRATSTPPGTPSPAPTDTPAPTPTPTPKWPPPLAEPGRSKLGIHVIQNNSPDIMDFIRVAKPRVVKAVGDLHWLIEVKEESPQTVTIGRIPLESQEAVGDPEEAARAFVAQRLAEYQFNAGVDYWEGWNEVDLGENMWWYARFEAERARQMAAHGLKVAVGGFAAGVPEWEEFEAFLPAIQAAKQYGGILTLHEYSAPTMDYLVGAGLPGHPSYPDRGALTLRYRWWYEDILKPRDLVIPLVISEAGIDGGVGSAEGPRGKGWRDFTGYWAEQGLGNDSTWAYIQQLAWYDEQVQRDDYVIGFTVFTAGPPRGEWESFDITPILPELARYVVSLGER